MQSLKIFNPALVRIFAFILCLSLLTACSPLNTFKEMFSDDGSGYIFKMSLGSDPKNLDPQIAEDKSSIAVASNMFSGLVKTEPDGGIDLWIASDYSISPDGLKYTFTLDDRYSWKAAGGFSAPVTAHDFVFAFKRLFDKNTGSVYAEDYFSIKGAEEAYMGTGSLSDIGVKAINDYTLEFTLQYPNAEFLSLLSRLPASPCNEEFFNSCKGKYGLESESIASNGPFYLRYWQHDPYGKDNYLRLRRNDGYSEVSRVYPAGVNFLIEKNDDVMLSDFTDGITDVYLSGTILDDFNYKKLVLSSCGLVFSPKNEILMRSDVKEVLSLSINREALAERLPGYIATAKGVIPPDAYVGSTKYRGSVKDIEIESNESLAEYKWSFILTEKEKTALSGINIMVPNSFLYADYLSEITAMWRKTLGLSVGIEIVNFSDYEKRIKGGDYDICLAVLNSADGFATDYLKPFAESEFLILNKKCVSSVKQSGKYSSLTSAIFDISEAERSLINEYDYIPLWYMPQFMLSSEDCEDLYLNVFSGTVIFEKAKHY